MKPARGGWRTVRRLSAALAVLTIVGCAAGVVPPVHSEQERLALARRMKTRGNCTAAIELLKVYVANNAGSADVDEALYDLGDCYLKTKDWASAAVEFERLLRDYPESDSAASASFGLGAAYFGQSRGPDFEQDQTVQALHQWQRYLRNYPGHYLNAEAKRRVSIARHRLATKLANTGKLYLKLKLPGPARVYFQRVVDEYSDTALLGDALLGLAMCDAVQGKHSEAIAQLDAIEKEFPGKPIAERAARERERLRR